MFNPFMTKKSIISREVVADMIKMVSQGYQPSELLLVKKFKAETIALGWEGVLKQMRTVLEEKGLQAILLQPFGGPLTLQISPTALLRYSDGRLNPRDQFGQQLWNVIKMMTGDSPFGVLTKENEIRRAHARAKGALENFSLDLAAKSGKSAREYPCLTARMMDWVEPDVARINPKTIKLCALKMGREYWLIRHPLPTRGKVTIIGDTRVPEGTILTNPATAQDANSEDADGDQTLLIPDWEMSESDIQVGPQTYMDGVASIGDTTLTSWLKVKPLKEKLGYSGMLKMTRKEYINTISKLSEYSVSGIGQVGYGPALAITTLALVGVEEFRSMTGTGFRRMYEDLMLAGMTSERWELFEQARSLETPQGKQLIPHLNELFQKAGIDFDAKQTQKYVIARLLVKAISQIERYGYASKSVIGSLGGYAQYISIYGLVRAVDAGKLQSTFIKNYRNILEHYDSKLPLVATLKEVCPNMLNAQQQTLKKRELNKQRAEAMA